MDGFICNNMLCSLSWHHMPHLSCKWTLWLFYVNLTWTRRCEVINLTVFFCTIIINFQNLLVRTTEIGLFSLSGLLSHLQTTKYPLEKISFIRLKTIHSRFEKFNFKNSQEYRHMIWNGKTNRPSQKGLVIQRACSEISWTTLYINFPRIQYRYLQEIPHPLSQLTYFRNVRCFVAFRRLS